MLGALAFTAVSSSTIRTNLDDQYYNQLAKSAADAGVEYAKACNISVSGLKPDTGCTGSPLMTSSPFVVSSVSIQSTFTVTSTLDADSTISDIVSVGTVNLLKTSDSSVWRTYSQTARLSKVPLSRRQITAGTYHTCFISYDDLAYCWGKNDAGELGNNSTTISLVPIAVYTDGVFKDKTVKSIAAGENYTCAIASDDKAYCWGYNYAGQVGDNSKVSRSVPTAVYTDGVLKDKTIKSIATGVNHTCVVDSNGQAYCWGRNNIGKLGNGLTDDSSVPVVVNVAGLPASDKAFVSITVGESYTCALTVSQKIYCWGDSNLLGNGTSSSSSVPVLVDTTNLPVGYKAFKSVTAGTYHACAIASNDKAYCWGNGNSGELGYSASPATYVLSPIAVDTSGVLNSKTITYIAASHSFTCATDSDGVAYCWGYNGYGQLGDGTNNTRLVPIKVISTVGSPMYGKKIVSIGGGQFHTCAADSSGKAYCWGLNNYGEFGNNSTTSSLVPIATWVPPYHADYF